MTERRAALVDDGAGKRSSPNTPSGRLGKALHRASRTEIRDDPEEVSAVREKRPNTRAVLTAQLVPIPPNGF